MSKLITHRYEYASYDDAAGILNPAKDVPPTYPPTIDTYRVGSTAAIAQSYGSQVVNSVNAQPAFTLPNATLMVFCPTTNTTLVGVSVLGATLTLGGSPTTAVFYCGPGQTITIPGSVNSGNLSLAAYTLALATTPVAFSATLNWNL